MKFNNLFFKKLIFDRIFQIEILFQTAKASSASGMAAAPGSPAEVQKIGCFLLILP